MSTRTDFPHGSRTSDTRTQRDTEAQRRNSRTEDLLRQAAVAPPPERADLLERVVLLHVDVADSLAHRYSGRGPETADLEQVARLALVEAAERADADRGDFLPFAVTTIRGCLKRHFRDHCWVVRPPRRVQGLQTDATTAWSHLAQELGRTPSSREVAARVRHTQSELGEAQLAGNCFRPASLDAPVRSDDPSAADLGSRLGAPDTGYDVADWVNALRPACAELSSADRRMLYLRFFEERTQQEIGGVLGVSQMQVSRSLQRVLAHLRDRVDDPTTGNLPVAA